VYQENSRYQNWLREPNKTTKREVSVSRNHPIVDETPNIISQPGSEWLQGML
jgi:hypothetical protein